MAADIGLGVERDVFDPQITSSELGIARLAAGAYVVLFLIVDFQPFVLLRQIPGSVGWGLLPMLGVAALMLAPSSDLSRVPVSFAFLAIGTWFAMSLAWSQSFGVGFFMVRSQVPALVLLMLVVGTMRPDDTIRILLAVFTGIAAWSLLTSLLLVQSRIADIGTGPDDVRLQEGWRGTFIHKNVFGAFAVLGMATVFVFVRRRGVRTALLIIFVILIFGTRSATAGGGLLAAAVAASALTWINRIDNHRGRALAKIGSVILLLFGIATVSAALPVFAELYGKDLTFSGRTDIWAASWDTITQRPWIGYGSGTVWHDQTGAVTADLHRRIGFSAAHAHNGVLDLLLAGGIIGLTLFVIVFFSLVRLAVRSLSSETAAPYGQWIIITLAGIFMMGISEPLFERPVLGLLLIMWSVTTKVTAAEAAHDARVAVEAFTPRAARTDPR